MHRGRGAADTRSPRVVDQVQPERESPVAAGHSVVEAVEEDGQREIELVDEPPRQQGPLGQRGGFAREEPGPELPRALGSNLLRVDEEEARTIREPPVHVLDAGEIPPELWRAVGGSSETREAALHAGI